MTDSQRHGAVALILLCALFLLGLVGGQVVTQVASQTGQPAWSTCLLYNTDTLHNLVPFIYYGGLVVVALAAGFVALRTFGMSAAGGTLAGMLLLSGATFGPNYLPRESVAYADTGSCLLIDGSNAMTGPIKLDGNGITNDTTAANAANVVRSATYVLCASDAQEPGQCDAVVVGDATAELEAAVAALPDTGGTLSLCDGGFTVNDWDITKSGVVVQGCSSKATVLTLAPGGTVMIDALNLGGPVNSVMQGLVLRDLELDCAWQPNSIALRLDGVQDSLFENVIERRCITSRQMISSASADRNTSRNTFVNWIDYGALTSIYMEGSASGKEVTHNVFVNNAAWAVSNQNYLNGLINLKAWADNNTWIGGLLALDCNGVAGQCDGGGVGVVFNSGNPGVDNEVYENKFYAYAINDDTGLTTAFVCNETETNRWNYMDLVIGGLSSSAPTFNTGCQLKLGPASRITAKPVQTKGTATITSGSTSATVTHGLALTPAAGDCLAVALENPASDPGTLWIDTYTATQFNINVEADPGVSNLDVAWQCDVGY